MKMKQELDREIGGRIKKAREAAGLTQDKFGELIQMGAKNVSAVERGVVGISLLTLRRICEVLSVSSDYLLFGSEGEKSDVRLLAERLSRLPPKQFNIVWDVFNKLLEAFALK